MSLSAPVEFLVMFATSRLKAALWKTDTLDYLEEKEEGNGYCVDTVKRFILLLPLPIPPSIIPVSVNPTCQCDSLEHAR